MRQWQPAGLLILAFMVLQFVGPESLRYQAGFVDEVQWWRGVTGHWVHANWMHFLLNMAGLVLCVALTSVDWKLWQWAWRIVILSCSISTGFYLLQPTLGWYVGFSGVLFGLYVMAAVETLPHQPFMSVIILCFTGIKIALEQGSPANITSADLIGVPVLVDAHLYGVLTAVSVIILQHIFQRLRKRSE